MDIDIKTPRQLRLYFAQKLRALYSMKESFHICQRLFEEFLGWSPAEVQINLDSVLEESLCIRFEEALDKLLKAIPVQYVIGHAQFLDLKLVVEPGVFIPRPETEELAALVIREWKWDQSSHVRVLDIGTGSGCLALIIRNRIGHADVTAIENSPRAVEISKKNARLHSSDIRILEADFLDSRNWSVFPIYDVILSNPPYVPRSEQSKMHPNVFRHEPSESLFVPDDDPLMFYKAIAKFAPAHLAPDGILYAEIHESFGEQIAALFREHGFGEVIVYNDFRGKNRFIRCRWDQ